MKVTIFTYNRSYNYGASLQSFALQRFVRKLGHECKVIDTRNKEELANKIPGRKDVKGIVINLSNWIHKKELMEGRARFNAFGDGDDRTANYSSNNDSVVDYQRLENDPPRSDVYISGSDQVFSPLLMSKLYFFDFDTCGAKKISYAASIGVTNIPKDKKEQFISYINKFDAVSVREPSAKEIIDEITEKKAEINIDPTFLLDAEEWMGFEKPYKELEKQKYILAYFIYRPKKMNSWLKKLHKSSGLPIVLVETSAFRCIYSNKTILDAGPAEFLWLVRNAEKIITSSLHGTAMSIIFNKPFAVCNNKATPIRIDNILNKFGLENHLVKDLRDGVIPEFDYDKQDLRRIADVLLSERNKAREYLVRNIK